MPEIETVEQFEQTLVIAKPEAVRANLIFQIAGELVELGLNIRLQMHYDFFDHPGKAKSFYAELADKPYFREPVLAIQRGPVHIFLVEGLNAIQIVRSWLGPTKIKEALETDTFRGRALREHGTPEPEESYLGRAGNYAHASSSVEGARYEIGLFFPDQLLIK